MRQKSVVVLAVVLLTSFNIFLVSSQRGQTVNQRCGDSYLSGIPSQFKSS